MLLTNNELRTNIYFVKTITCSVLFVNEGNNINPCSHGCSLDKLLKHKIIINPCERVNDFSRAYVEDYFYSLLFAAYLIDILIFIFFIHTRAHILLFTRSHLNKIYIKTNGYRVNDIDNSFTCYSHSSHEG